MDEQQINENKTLSGDDIACPNCGSHNVRCVPYPKVEFGAWFILWLVVAFGGYMISVFITIAGIVFWSIALVIRLKQNKLAKQYMAERKLKPHFKDGKLPIAAWRREREQLEQEYRDIQTELSPFHADAKKLWAIHYNIYEVQHEQERQNTATRQKKQEIER